MLGGGGGGGRAASGRCTTFLKGGRGSLLESTLPRMGGPTVAKSHCSTYRGTVAHSLGSESYCSIFSGMLPLWQILSFWDNY